MASEKSLRVCDEGHHYYKSSDCLVCPICDNMKKTDDGWLSVFSAPARRALVNAGIKTISDLSIFTEREILKLHGMGPGSIPKLRQALRSHGLSFKK